MKLSVNNTYHNDWVIFDGNYNQIHSTTPEYPFLKNASFGVGIVVWNNIQPISLTGIILEKIEGMEKIRLMQYRFGKRLFIIRDGIVFDYSSDLSLPHVHTFQQLIRLFTGKEIEIKW
jgi:hypothetical protein